MNLESKKTKLVLPKESYELMGILFEVHNRLGPICKEKNYQDAIELIFKERGIPYEREKEVEIPFGNSTLKGFYVDFVVDNKIILEVKAKRFIKNEDIRQSSRYLKATGLPLVIIVNFKRAKLEYKRVINPHPASFTNSRNIRNIRDEPAMGRNGRRSGRVPCAPPAFRRRGIKTIQQVTLQPRSPFFEDSLPATRRCPSLALACMKVRQAS